MAVTLGRDRVGDACRRSSKLIRIEPGGATATIDLPRPGAVPTDVAVGTDGSVWFLQFRANRIGR